MDMKGPGYNGVEIQMTCNQNADQSLFECYDIAIVGTGGSKETGTGRGTEPY